MILFATNTNMQTVLVLSTAFFGFIIVDIRMRTARQFYTCSVSHQNVIACDAVRAAAFMIGHVSHAALAAS